MTTAHSDAVALASEDDAKIADADRHFHGGGDVAEEELSFAEAEALGRAFFTMAPRREEHHEYDYRVTVEVHVTVDATNPSAAESIAESKVERFFRDTKHPFVDVNVCDTEAE